MSSLQEDLTFTRVTLEDFVNARNKCERDKYKSFMPLTSVDEIHEAGSRRCFLSNDRLTGFMVTSDTGEFINLFNNGPKGQGSLACIAAINEGARHLDCFDGYLTKLYHSFGFIEVKRLTWDEYLNVAPASWDESSFYTKTFGKPDVVFMELGKGKDALRVVESPDKNLLVKNFRPYKRGAFLGKLEGPLLNKLTQHSLTAWRDGKRLFIDDPIFGYTAHGCDPNVELKKDGSFYATKDICAGDVLYMDYSVSEEKLFRQFKCLCGAFACRGLITGFGEENTATGYNVRNKFDRHGFRTSFSKETKMDL